MSKQKSYTSEFKFKVAVEMIKGDLTIAEIISKYQVPCGEGDQMFGPFGHFVGFPGPLGGRNRAPREILNRGFDFSNCGPLGSNF